MQGADLLFFLMDDQKRSYYTDEFGAILISTQPKPLTFSPDGWDEISIMKEVNKKYYGLDRTFTIPLNFVEDGARIAKHHYYTNGGRAKLTLLILEQKLYFDATHYGFYYDYLYDGLVDLSTFKHKGPKVTNNVIEGGLAKLVKANENTIYEIDIDIADAQEVLMDGMLFENTSYYKVLEGEQIGTALPIHNVPIVFVNKEGYSIGVTNSSFTGLSGNSPLLTNNGDDYAARIYGSVNFKIKYAPDKYILTIQLRKEDNSIVTLFSHEVTTALNVAYTISFDFNTTIFAGASLLVKGQYVPAASPGNLVNLKMEYFETSVSVDDNTRLRSSNIKSVSWLYVFEQLVKKITNDTYLASSTLLDSNRQFRLTSGDAIRGIAGAKIKTSLAKCFNSANVVYNAGMGIINGKLAIEDKDFWLNPVSTIDLGEVIDLSISHAPEYDYTAIEIGYPDQTYEEVNGRSEPNGTLSFTTPLTTVEKKLTLISDYRADPYGIEYARTNNEGKISTDSSSDNDTFILHTTTVPNAQGLLELDRTINATASGVIDPATIFNLKLSPKHCFYKHGWYFRSFLRGLEGEYIVYQTTDKNAELVSDGITEKANVLIGHLEAPKFHPVLIEFETKVPDVADHLDDSVVDYTLTYAGFTLKGYPQKSGFDPSTRKAQVFQLLANADMDLTKLIDLYE